MYIPNQIWTLRTLKDIQFLDTLVEVSGMTFTCCQIYALKLNIVTAIYDKGYYFTVSDSSHLLLGFQDLFGGREVPEIS